VLLCLTCLCLFRNANRLFLSIRLGSGRRRSLRHIRHSEWFWRQEPNDLFRKTVRLGVPEEGRKVGLHPPMQLIQSGQQGHRKARNPGTKCDAAGGVGHELHARQ
jgi:hypothetical protein